MRVLMMTGWLVLVVVVGCFLRGRGCCVVGGWGYVVDGSVGWWGAWGLHASPHRLHWKEMRACCWLHEARDSHIAVCIWPVCVFRRWTVAVVAVAAPRVERRS